MKKLLLILIALTIFSCSKEEKKDFAIITGQIDNLDKSSIKLYDMFTQDVIKDIKFDENGKFIDTISISNNNSFMLTNNRNYTELYLKKGDSLNINYDANDYKNSIKVSGTASDVYDYFIAKKEKQKEILGEGTAIYKKEEAAYKEAHQKVKQAHEDLLFNAQNISELFKAKEKRNINYSYLADLYKYESYHGYYAKKKDFKASDDFLAETKNLDLENEQDFLNSESYRTLVTSKITNEVQVMFEKDSTIDGDIAMLNKIANINSQKIKNKLLFDQAKYGITYTNNLEEFYTIYEANSTNKENNTKIKESYTNLKKLAKGSPSPQFKNYENYAGGTTSSRDLKGKYVYIDVWATWCGPCIAEIPSLKKVEKQFHNEDIQFLSISIDDKKDYDKWRKMIADKELGGMQLMAENAWDSKFVKDFMIKGIPRFILLDKEGNIIDANAPRPSDKKLVDVLNGLNSKNDLKLQP